jgi:hypothetical protein
MIAYFFKDPLCWGYASFLVILALALGMAYYSLRNTEGMGAMVGLLLIPVFLIGGFLYGHLAQHHRALLLVQNGRRISATITSVEENTHIRMNYQSPWVIYARWQDPDTLKTYTFHSSLISHDPRSQLSAPTIDVVMDPQDPTHYYMDLTVLYKTKPVDPYEQMRQMQKQVDDLKQEVTDLKKKQNTH